MEFSSGLTRVRNRGGSAASTPKTYPCSLQMYTLPPVGNVSLAEFDSMAVERLKILRAVERHNLSGPIKGSDEWVAKIYEEFHKNKNFIISTERISETKAAEVLESRRRDHVSHFILRLAYCRTEELRRWFVSMEVDLLRARFLHTANSKQDILAFIRDNNMYFAPISNEEFQRERENLLNGTHRVGSGDQLEGRTFYKVSFTEALDLVRSRRVFLRAGYAYVPDTELVTLIAAVYRANLSKALAITSRALPQLEDDDRLMRLLQDFDRRYTGSDYSSKKSADHAITPAMLDTLAAKAFPLCMRKLHDTLTTTHHLKHGGRMQYGLFLKAAGLSLEDALHFWRSHFTKIMDADKFDKQYAYSIRHNYGKEGKRTEYSPYSCIKIITGAVGPGESHGCPFKLSDAPLLRQRLTGYGVNSSSAGEIVELSAKGHYQIACQKYWEATHQASLDTGINHPNQYLEESRKQAALTPGSTPVPVRKTELKTVRSVLQPSQCSNTSSLTPSSQRQASQDASQTSLLQSQKDFEFDDDFDMDFDELDASIELHNAAAALKAETEAEASKAIALAADLEKVEETTAARVVAADTKASLSATSSDDAGSLDCELASPAIPDSKSSESAPSTSSNVTAAATGTSTTFSEETDAVTLEIAVPSTASVITRGSSASDSADTTAATTTTGTVKSDSADTTAATTTTGTVKSDSADTTAATTTTGTVNSDSADTTATDTVTTTTNTTTDTVISGSADVQAMDES